MLGSTYFSAAKQRAWHALAVAVVTCATVTATSVKAQRVSLASSKSGASSADQDKHLKQFMDGARLYFTLRRWTVVHAKQCASPRQCGTEARVHVRARGPGVEVTVAYEDGSAGTVVVGGASIHQSEDVRFLAATTVAEARHLADSRTDPRSRRLAIVANGDWTPTWGEFQWSLLEQGHSIVPLRQVMRRLRREKRIRPRSCTRNIEVCMQGAMDLQWTTPAEGVLALTARRTGGVLSARVRSPGPGHAARPCEAEAGYANNTQLPRALLAISGSLQKSCPVITAAGTAAQNRPAAAKGDAGQRERISPETPEWLEPQEEPTRPLVHYIGPAVLGVAGLATTVYALGNLATTEECVDDPCTEFERTNVPFAVTYAAIGVAAMGGAIAWFALTTPERPEVNPYEKEGGSGEGRLPKTDSGEVKLGVSLDRIVLKGRF